MARLDSLFQELIQKGGSDLHVAAGEPPKIRVHGDIHPVRDEPLEAGDLLAMMEEICSPSQFKRYRDSNDLDWAHALPSGHRFRVNYYAQTGGPGAVFRLIPDRIQTLEEIFMPPVLKTFGHLRGGLVLVTGPTGSGKSTTLAAVVDYINSNLERQVVTIEEPVEFVHSHKRSIITQREVPLDTPSFARGLKAALRQDCDVVLVGEMRDVETIGLALTAAETGLLVFGTLHTSSARKTIDRLIDVFPHEQQPQIRTMLASSLRGVCAQLLMKRVDRPGRIAVTEVLLGNPAVGAIIREGATQKLTDAIVGGRSEGMHLMDDSILALAERGIVSGRESYMKASDKTRFAKYATAVAGGAKH